MIKFKLLKKFRQKWHRILFEEHTEIIAQIEEIKHAQEKMAIVLSELQNSNNQYNQKIFESVNNVKILQTDYKELLFRLLEQNSFLTEQIDKLKHNHNNLMDDVKDNFNRIENRSEENNRKIFEIVDDIHNEQNEINNTMRNSIEKFSNYNQNQSIRFVENLEMINHAHNEIKNSLEVLSNKSDIMAQREHEGRDFSRYMLIGINNKVENVQSSYQSFWPMIYSIDSWCQNEFILNRCKGLSVLGELPLYSRFYKIRELLKVYKIVGDKTLIRMGRDEDGGYVMLDCFEKEGIAYSFGINDDVSWDLDIANKGYHVYQYDPSIESLPEKHENFHFFKIGVAGEAFTSHWEFMSLEDILIMNGHLSENDMILKMDVEGYEWDVFNSISSEIIEKFSQIVLEIHGLNRLEYESVIPALEKISLTHNCISIHGNNHSETEYIGDISMQYTMEITLVRKNDYEFELSKGVSPSIHDRRCNPMRREMILTNWNNE
ncbi:FkbM family methyltransferase [Fusibacter paucivorans]|uniref:FkbM family methyltransferase n=1 Tax=Fusibacter paucivorans TaxID=76009 RepID=A0ABS5PQF8_9FIRM|nr:FkbM family methyltransferase [Fusibacter paucivorans]MBS7526611.1 FkbM family methyltransferase [Fusibacter paucivorans]